MKSPEDHPVARRRRPRRVPILRPGGLRRRLDTVTASLLLPILAVAVGSVSGCSAPGRQRNPPPGAQALTASAGDEPVSRDPGVDSRDEVVQGIPKGVAFLLVELPGYRVIDRQHGDILETAIAPGSLAKIATLAVALEQRIVAPDARLPCRRRVRIDGHDLTCSHPEFGRPLTLAEALAHSCNDAFSSIAARLPRSALSAEFVHLGLSPIAPGVSTVSAALGLDGTHATPEALLRGFTDAIVTRHGSAWRPDTRAVITAGLSLAAREGTAAIIGDRGLDALAKTGTSPMPGGGVLGAVVAWWPAQDPVRAVIVIAPGAAGRDAASVAATLLSRRESSGRGLASRQSAPAISRTVRVGHVREDGRFDITEWPIDDYVASVVAAEAEPDTGPEGLAALAIAVRSYAEANRDRHAQDGFDLCDLTHCQVVGKSRLDTVAAARATTGRVLIYSGRVAEIVYTANCGGSTELPDAAWPSTAPRSYFRRHAEPECARDTAWSCEIRQADLVRALGAAGLRGGRLDSLEVGGRSPAGLVTFVRATGMIPTDLSGEMFRLAVGRTVGWQFVKSNRFRITRTASGYRFDGSGRGHLVGLCLAGAARLARAGAGRDAILSTYFSGLTIGTMPQHGDVIVPNVDLRLPAEAERSRAAVLDAVTRILAGLRQRTGQQGPSRIEIVFHPTVAAYERDTGQHWWTSASASHARVDLLPVSVLASRGILDRTLRHELAHVLTEPALVGRARWVREGAAAYFADEGPDRAAALGSRQPATDCPSDREFGESRDLPTTEALYARALGCFVEALERTGRWQDVGRTPSPPVTR